MASLRLFSFLQDQIMNLEKQLNDAREDYINILKEKEESEQTRRELTLELAEKAVELTKKAEELEDKGKQLEEKTQELAKMQAENASLEEDVDRLNTLLSDAWEEYENLLPKRRYVFHRNT